jgi:Alanine dehydrogenase/PNT, C-terminal domain
MGADAAVLDRNPEALRRVDAVLGNRVRTLFSTHDVVELFCPRADLVIATVLVPGSTTPKLITAQTVKAVKTGAMASFGTIEAHPWLTASVQVFGLCATSVPLGRTGMRR